MVIHALRGKEKAGVQGSFSATSKDSTGYRGFCPPPFTPICRALGKKAVLDSSAILHGSNDEAIRIGRKKSAGSPGTCPEAHAHEDITFIPKSHSKTAGKHTFSYEYTFVPYINKIENYFIDSKASVSRMLRKCCCGDPPRDLLLITQHQVRHLQ